MSETKGRPGAISTVMVRERNKYLEQFGRFYTLAIEMAVAVIVPMLIGLWLDKKTGKSPWFTLAGTILGGAAAIRSAHRTLSEALREREKKEREHSTHEGRNGGFSS